MSSVRLVHFSDIHLTASPLGWKKRDLLTKRVTGLINLKAFGRGDHFADAETIVSTFMADMMAKPPDRLIFSGDATGLGFESELARAADLLNVTDAALPGLAVPGNHDYYLPPVAKSGQFERYFAPWQNGERVADAVYPLAQRVGNLWLVAVNSSKGNRAVWDATGAVDGPQLRRLEQLLKTLSPGPRILVTHYPVCLANGSPEKPHHGLRNLAEVVDVAARGGVCLWLHGHRHETYFLPRTNLAPFPVSCAGSLTHAGHGTYFEYNVNGSRLTATLHVYEDGRFRDGERFEVDLKASEATDDSAQETRR